MNGNDVVITGMGIAGFVFILLLVWRWVNNRNAVAQPTGTPTGNGTGTGTGTGATGVTGTGTTGGTTPPSPPPGTDAPPPTTTTTVVTPATPDPAMPPNEVMAMLREGHGRITGLDLVTDNQRGYSRLSVQLDHSDEVVEKVAEMAKAGDVEAKTANGASLTVRQRPLTPAELEAAGQNVIRQLLAGNAPAAGGN